METIRILIADEHIIFLEALKRLLEDEEGFVVIGQASDGEELVEKARNLQPDVVLLDVMMPKLNGIESIRQIKEILPTCAVLVMSAHSYEAYVIATLRAGAAGFLSKSAHGSDLIAAIKAVKVGEPVIDQAAAYRILTRLVPVDDIRHKASFGDIHARELEVLRKAARGMTNREIARELCISERTVQTHFINLFRKLNVGSRTEAVLKALKEGWLSLEDLP